MIVDAFIFYNELSILELRLAMLSESVDAFVLVRGSRTFRGALIPPGPLEEPLQTLMARYPLDVCVVDMPAEAWSPWEREHMQRNAVADGVAALLRPNADDVILLSDVDEIPSSQGIDKACRILDSGGVACFQQLHSYFALDLIDDEPWFGTRAARWSVLKTVGAQALRAGIPHQTIVAEGGWHFGWTGGNDAIRTKVSAFSHAELDAPEFMSDERLNGARAAGTTIHNGHALRKARWEELPDYVRRHPEKVRALLSQSLQDAVGA